MYILSLILYDKTKDVGKTFVIQEWNNFWGYWVYFLTLNNLPNLFGREKLKQEKIFFQQYNDMLNIASIEKKIIGEH